MADPFTVTRTSHPDSPQRWQSAYARALTEELMIRPNLYGGGIWTVTSKTRPDLVYGTNGVVCGCKAAETGDPICKHRALYRAVHGTLPQASVTAPVVFIHRRKPAQPIATTDDLAFADGFFDCREGEAHLGQRLAIQFGTFETGSAMVDDDVA